MAANTVGVKAVEFQIAHNVGDLNAGIISTYTSATSMACVNITESTDDTFNGGFIRVMGGSTYGTISDYTGSSRTFTLTSPGLTTAVNAVLQWCGFNALKRTAMFEAINSAIRDSWGTFYRETTVTRSSATITLVAGTQTYSLPAACAKLIQIGIQPATTDGITWFDPLDIWRVYGEEGAYTLECLPAFGAINTLNWTNRVRVPGLGSSGTFADAFGSEPLCLKYLEREPEVDDEADSIRLPINYLGWVGADYYSQWLLANGTDEDRRTLNVSLPQIQQQATRARAQLSLTKPKMRQTVSLDF